MFHGSLLLWGTPSIGHMCMVAFPSSHEKEAWLLYFCDVPPPEAALSYVMMVAWQTSAQEAQQHESHTCVCTRCAIEG